ncbi:hypothetical protein M885DRAFT_577149 [Pelagophyceae sp. CCMP2097]|nr:hypothetical protein M885DRAFT_577149 [Pelagophyceae sp. CCMP2097]
MAKKRGYQLLVSIESLLVMALLSTRGGTFSFANFVFQSMAGRVLLGFGVVAVFAPAHCGSFCHTGRWFSSDLVVGTIAQSAVIHPLLSSSKSGAGLDFNTCMLVAMFGWMQLFWANGLNCIWDFHLGADVVPVKAKEGKAKEGDPAPENHGDDLRLTEGKVQLEEILAHTWIMFAAMCAFGTAIYAHVEPGQYLAVTYLLVASAVLLAGYSTPPLVLKYRALGEATLVVWALHVNALLAVVAFKSNPLAPDFIACSLVCAVLRGYPNFCFNVRDAPSDSQTPGLQTVATLLGPKGIVAAYWATVLAVLPAGTAILAVCCGPPVLLALLLLPFGVGACCEASQFTVPQLSDSWRFYDYTQFVTCAYLGIQCAQALQVY